MGNNMCNPEHVQKTLLQNDQLQITLLKNRKEVKELPAIPVQMREKIISLLHLQNLDIIHENRKIWKVSSPYHFIYINEPAYKDTLPCGICSIFLYKKKNQLIAFFRGQVNSNGFRENKSSLYVFQNGDYFQGSKTKNDYGIYTDGQSEYKYEGDWINGKPHGIGIEQSKKGKYQGYFYKGKKHGEGKYTFDNGYIYEGQFNNDEITGQGRLNNQKENYSYIGAFINGQKQGRGIEKTQAYSYEGIFNRNKKQGHGKLIKVKQSKQFEGHFYNNIPNGKGKLKQNGFELQGVWENGKLINISNYET